MTIDVHLSAPLAVVVGAFHSERAKPNRVHFEVCKQHVGNEILTILSEGARGEVSTAGRKAGECRFLRLCHLPKLDFQLLQPRLLFPGHVHDNRVQVTHKQLLLPGLHKLS